MYMFLYIIILITVVNCDILYKIHGSDTYLDPNKDTLILDQIIYQIEGDDITIIPFNEIKKHILKCALNMNYIPVSEQLELIYSSASEIKRKDLDATSKMNWNPCIYALVLRTVDNSCHHGTCFNKEWYTIASSNFNFDNFNNNKKKIKVINFNSDLYTNYYLSYVFIPVSWHVFGTHINDKYILNNYYLQLVYNMVLNLVRNTHLNDKVVLLDNEDITKVTTPLQLFKGINSNNKNTFNGIDYFTRKSINLTYSINMIENRECKKLYISGTMYLCDVNHYIIYKVKKFDIFKLTTFRCLSKGNFDYCTPFYIDDNNSTSPIYIFYNGEIYYDTYVFNDKKYSNNQLNLFKEYKNCDLIKKVYNKIICLIITKMIDPKTYYLTLVNNIEKVKNREIPKNNLESYNPNLNYPNCPKIQTCKYDDFIESKIRLLLHTIGSITTEISVKISEILEISNYMEKNNICSELVTNVEKLIKKQILFKEDPSLTELLNDIKNLGEMTCNNETSIYIRNKYYNNIKIEIINKKRSIEISPLEELTLNNLKCLKNIEEMIDSEVEKKIKKENLFKIYEKRIEIENTMNCQNYIEYYVLLHKFEDLKYNVNTLILYQGKLYYPKEQNK